MFPKTSRPSNISTMQSVHASIGENNPIKCNDPQSKTEKKNPGLFPALGVLWICFSLNHHISLSGGEVPRQLLKFFHQHDLDTLFHFQYRARLFRCQVYCIYFVQSFHTYLHHWKALQFTHVTSCTHFIFKAIAVGHFVASLYSDYVGMQFICCA